MIGLPMLRDFHTIFEADSITDTSRKKAVQISVCGTETFSLLKDLITTDNLQDKTFDEQSLLNGLTFICADNKQTK